MKRIFILIILAIIFLCTPGQLFSIFKINTYNKSIISSNYSVVDDKDDKKDKDDKLKDKEEKIKDKDDKIKKCLRYMKNRIDKLDYKTAIENGLPIGSGEIESANRSIVQKRLKIPGAWWKKETVEYMLALICLRENEDWEEFWKWEYEKLKAA